jgi:hypothetical protein
MIETKITSKESYQIVRASQGMIGFDTDTKITQTAGAFVVQEFHFALRYVSLNEKEAQGDLTKEEVYAILEAGLGLMPVQHVREPGWIPTAALGLRDGNVARVQAYLCGFLPHCTVWLDLEGVDQKVSKADVVAYTVAWANSVRAWGYHPGLYVGAQSRLDQEDLTKSMPYRYFWRSISASAPQLNENAYALCQDQGSIWQGIAYDCDRIPVHTKATNLPWMMRKR